MKADHVALLACELMLKAEDARKEAERDPKEYQPMMVVGCVLIAFSECLAKVALAMKHDAA